MNALSLPTSPHLITASSHPLEELERHILSRRDDDIEIWFRQQSQEYPAPFYTSVDLSNAGFKLASVDTNIFPVDLNNLNTHGMSFEPLAFAETCITPDKELSQAA
jgi:glutamate--cysteine ligase